MSLASEIERDALCLLSAREHSRMELKRKLAARGHSHAATAELLDDLERRGLLSEARMVEAYVAERLRKGFGPLRIRMELRQRGIPDALIEPHLSTAAQDWLDLMRRVHDKKYGPEPPSSLRELARRVRFLESRGFPADLIGRFMRLDDTHGL